MTPKSKRQRLDIVPRFIKDDVCRDASTESVFVLQHAFVMKGTSFDECINLWGDEYKLSVVDDHMTLQGNISPDPERLESMAERLRVDLEDVETIAPSVEELIAKKDQAKWMRMLIWIAKCIPLYSEPPVVEELSNSSKVVRGITTEVYGKEIASLRKDHGVKDVKIFISGTHLKIHLEIK